MSLLIHDKFVYLIQVPINDEYGIILILLLLISGGRILEIFFSESGKIVTVPEIFLSPYLS